MRKIKFASLLLSLVLCFSFILSGCGEKKPRATDAFEKSVEQIVTPITKDSEMSINEAYDQYYLLEEELRKSVSESKEKLDNYAALCKGIILTERKADAIGEYENYTSFSAKVADAKSEYDALLKLDGSYAADKTVSAAKAKIDAAQKILDGKDSKAKEFSDIITEMKTFSESGDSYSDWIAKLGEAQSVYNELNSSGDDITARTEIIAAKSQMDEYVDENSALEAIINDFSKKVEDAAAAIGETPVYSTSANQKIDLADQAESAAEAAKLLGDALLEDTETELDRLHAVYDGVRYVYEFNAAVNIIDVEDVQYSDIQSLQSAIDAAKAAYEKVPEANRTEVSDGYSKLTAAEEIAVKWGAYKEFVDAVSDVDLAVCATVSDADAKVAIADALYEAVIEDGYESGNVAEVDEAKTLLESKRIKLGEFKLFISKVDALPEQMTMSQACRDALKEAEAVFEGFSAQEKSYPLIADAYTVYSGKLSEFNAAKKVLFTTPAKRKDGTDIVSGFVMPNIDGNNEDADLTDNFVQILFDVASVKDGTVNGVQLSTDGSNVDDEAFKEYIAANFEYVYTVTGKYKEQADIELMTVTKPVTYEQTVPTADELNEKMLYGYTYDIKVAIRIKADATDSDLSWMINTGDEQTVSVTVDADSSLINGTKISDFALISELIRSSSLRYIQWGRNGSVISEGADLCANQKFLANEAVGAYDIYIYDGKTTDTLIDWVRILPDPNDETKMAVKAFKGSDIESKGLGVLDYNGYIEAGISEFDNSWFTSKVAGYSNANSNNSSIKNILVKGLGGASGTHVTITTRLVVNDTYKALGVLDSDFSEPLVWKL